MSQDHKPSNHSAPDEKPILRNKHEKSADPKGGINPFWLEKVFPDPAAVFGFMSPTVSELAAECLYVLDTNILLAPYEIEPNSFQEIEGIYTKLADHDRLFIPAQVAREYGKTRGKKLSEVYQAVNDRLSRLPETKDLNCPILEGVKEYEDVKECVEILRAKAKETSEALGKLKEALTKWGWKDKVSSLYRKLLTKQRIIDHDKKTEDVTIDLEFRVAHSTPPGYKDASKIDGGIGDLLIWLSLIKLGKDRSKSVIFVTNEEKADWFIRSGKERVLPRTELALEFQRETGQSLAIMDWRQFLESNNATQNTVRDAVRAEANTHWLSMEFAERIALLFDLLNGILNEFVEESLGTGGSPPFISDKRLGRLERTFVSSVMEYEKQTNDSAASSILEEAVRILAKIVHLNGMLQYIELRQKWSGDEEREQLIALSRHFGVQYARFQAFRSANDYSE
jgi:PIN like domain